MVLVSLSIVTLLGTAALGARRSHWSDHQQAEALRCASLCVQQRRRCRRCSSLPDFLIRLRTDESGRLLPPASSKRTGVLTAFFHAKIATVPMIQMVTAM
jgi:hypothetical protein